MKSTLRSVLFVALMVAGAACASNSGSSTGTGGASGSGGTSSAGGSSSSGGSGSGGSSQTGGASGSGGTSSAGGATSSGSGGDKGTGGKAGSGGSQVRDAAPGTGGMQEMGGGPGQGGKLGTGGAGRTGGVQGGGGTQGKGGASAGDGGRIDGQGSDVIHARTITTRGFTFDALEAGPDDGEPVLLLHGFPEISLEWSGLMPVLAAAGYHCLAPDQRGYSPGARPTEVDAYKYAELVADGFAFGGELGAKFHLVAHDWGANIAWLMLQKDPSRIASYTALAVPHYQVWAKAVYDTSSDLNKTYLPMLTTWMTPEKGEAYWTESAMRSMWKKKPTDLVDQTIAHMLEPGCMTAALNWYRASDGHKSVINDFQPWTVDVPTLLIFGSTDLGQKTVTDSKPLVTSLKVVQPTGGHFIVDEQPKVVADETLAHLRAYPIK